MICNYEIYNLLKSDFNLHIFGKKKECYNSRTHFVHLEDLYLLFIKNQKLSLLVK